MADSSLRTSRRSEGPIGITAYTDSVEAMAMVQGP
jgi:hypothetical protein